MIKQKENVLNATWQITKHRRKKNATSGSQKGGINPNGVFMCSESKVPEEELWLGNSEAAAHMTSKNNYFLTFESFVNPQNES